MPRINGVFQLPPGVYGSPGTTILSAKYNTAIDDFAAEMNGVRPLTAGGTGAVTASSALTNLGFSAFAKTLVDDADASTTLTTLGFSAFAKTLVDDADASSYLSTLGFSAFAKTLIDDVDAATARVTLDVPSNAALALKAPLANPVFTGFMTLNTYGQISATGGGTAIYGQNLYYDIAASNFKLAYTNSIGWSALTLYNGDMRFAGASGATVAGTVVVPTFEKVWREGNDGAGSGLDADLLDGFQASALTGTVSAINTSTGVQLVDFTGIPSDAKFVSVNVGGVSLNGTDDILVQLGISTGAFATSGYAARWAFVTVGPTVTSESRPSPSGFTLIAGSASYQMYGSLLLTNMGNNTWVCTGNLVDTGLGINVQVAGNVVLTQALERIRLRASGSNTLDINSGVSVTYWR